MKKILLNLWYFFINEIPPQTACEYCERENPSYYDECPYETHDEIEDQFESKEEKEIYRKFKTINHKNSRIL